MSKTDHLTVGKPAGAFTASRLLLAAIVIVACSLAIRSAWRSGLGRVFARDASVRHLRDQANKAVESSPDDPETHSRRALVSYHSNDLKTAIGELERAVSLRPRDYFLWLQLGRTRDEARDKQGALDAMQAAITLAPYYSEPRWQYGNVLYRAHRFDEAFRELRQAAESEPSLFPVLMDLAWGTYGGDAKTVEGIIAPKTDTIRLSLARFFAKHGRIGEALTLFRASGGNAIEERKLLLIELLRAKQFKAAYEVWNAGRVAPAVAPAGLVNPGFEERIDLSDKSFGWWQEKNQEQVTLSLDTTEPRSGSSCLFIKWNGDSLPGSPIISQLVLTEPATRYRLSFFVRTENVVTAALPVVTITDAGGNDARLLGQSQALPQGTTQWNQYAAVFDTSASTDAVLVNIQRQSCPPGPCPIFGKVWFDDFSLRKD